MDDATRREILAALAHRQWSGWMEYLFSKCVVADDGGGNLIIPSDYVQALERQMYTKYTQLAEVEKELDRKEADKVLAALGMTGGQQGVKCFICTDAKGVYLQAVLLAFASDEETARALFDKVLKKADLHQSGPFSIQEIEIKPSARVLWNGDY